MKTTTPIKSSSIYLSLIRGLIVLVILIGIQPFLWNYVYTSTIHLQEKRTEAQQLVNLQARLDAMQARQASQKQFLDQLSATFPLLGSESQVIERIEQLALKVGIAAHITTITKQPLPLEDDKNGILTGLSLTVEADGTPSQLLYYLDALEHLPELTIIRSWGITAASGTVSNAPPLYKLNMNIIFYLQKPS